MRLCEIYTGITYRSHVTRCYVPLCAGCDPFTSNVNSDYTWDDGDVILHMPPCWRYTIVKIKIHNL